MGNCQLVTAVPQRKTFSLFSPKGRIHHYTENNYRSTERKKRLQSFVSMRLMPEGFRLRARLLPLAVPFLSLFVTLLLPLDPLPLAARGAGSFGAFTPIGLLIAPLPATPGRLGSCQRRGAHRRRLRGGRPRRGAAVVTLRTGRILGIGRLFVVRRAIGGGEAARHRLDGSLFRAGAALSGKRILIRLGGGGPVVAPPLVVKVHVPMVGRRWRRRAHALFRRG